MRPHALAPGFLLLLVPLAACGGPMTSLGEYHSYTIHEFAFVAGGRDLRTVIIGNPFAMDKETFDSRVLARMQGRNYGPITHFTTTPSETAHPAYRVLLLFNDTGNLTPSLLCRVASPRALGTETAEEGGVRVVAAFCRGAKTLSGTRGWLRRTIGPDEPGFGLLVESIVQTLFPPRDPKRHGRRR